VVKGVHTASPFGAPGLVMLPKAKAAAPPLWSLHRLAQLASRPRLAAPSCRDEAQQALQLQPAVRHDRL